MAQQGQVTKIYELKTLGYSDLTKQLDGVAAKFEKIRKAKHAAEAKMVANSDTAEMKKYTDQLAKLQIEEQKARVEREKTAAAIKALQLLRQEEINNQKKNKDGNLAEAGSIAEIRKQISELNKATIQRNATSGSMIDFKGQLLTYDQAIAKLKELTAADQAYRRQFQKDGTLVGEYTTGIIQAFKNMGLDDLIGGQITKAKQRVEELNTDFDRLQDELRQTKEAGKSTESIERQMIENRNEVIKLDTEVERLKTDLRGTSDVGSQISASLANGFKSVKGQLSGLILQYASFNALVNQAQAGIRDAYTSSDQTTDLEIQLGNSADEANRLNEALKSMNTRTTVIGLQQIADIALKAGVSAENIESVTEAIDKTKIAFGKDFGSIEQGTETFVKLINIFYEDGEITGERILQIGNSVRTLANETVASVPFLTDFSGRMAGLKQIANVTLPDILGLGAGFEEFKQSAEVASTVLVKVIPKLATDTAKYAEIAGMTKDAFSALINNNPTEALIRVTEAMVKSGKSIEDVSATFADSELGSGRITTILATLGGHADTFRNRIARAGGAIEDTGAITDAFNKKNNNLAATMDKVGKKMSDAFSGKAFQQTLLVLSTLLTGLITSLPVLIGLLGLLAIAWVAQNQVLIGARLQIIAYNIAIGASTVLINILRVAQLASIAVTYAYELALKGVTAAMRIFGITTTAATGPLGVFLALAGIIASALLGVNKAYGKSIEQLDANSKKMAALNDIQRESSKIYNKQVSEINAWVAVLKSAQTSIEAKTRAQKELSKYSAEFNGVIKDNVVQLDLLKTAYDNVTSAIRLQATAQATAQLSAEKKKNVTIVSSLKEQVSIEAAMQSVNPAKGYSKAIVSLEGLSSEEIALLKGIQSEATSLRIGAESAIFLQQDLEKVLKELTNIENQRIDVYSAYINAQVAAEKKLEDVEQAIADKNAKTFEVDIPALKKKIEDLNAQIDKFTGSKQELDKLIAERNKFQDQLNKLMGTGPKGSTGSKLSGEQKDLFKEIDAERDLLLAEAEKRFLENKVTEEQYLNEIYNINTTAIDKKLKLLKGANAEEKKQSAQLSLEKIKLERETNEKIYNIRSQALKDQLDIMIKNAKEVNDRVQEDPNKSMTEKAEHQLMTDKLILDAQLEFNAKMDALEKDRNDISKKNTEDRARTALEMEAKLRKDIIAVTLASIEDERRVGNKLIAEFKTTINQARKKILDSNASDSKKNKALNELEKQETIGVLAREIAELEAELPKLRKALNEKAITEEEYSKRYEEYVKKQKALSDILNRTVKDVTDLQSLASEGLRALFNIDRGSDTAKLLAETIGKTFELAENAMDSYYQSEADNIDRSRDLALERIEIERDQRLARAESMEEEEAIHKQFKAREEAENRKAFEKNKKLQREQAKINLAMQLSNLAVIAFAPNPLNIATLGTAGAIMYALQAAIAVANYALNIKKINSATYEKGGAIAPTKTGGEIKGPSHSQGGVPFEYKEAEGKELMIINKRSAQDKKIRTITGTNKQIASRINELGGGIRFAPGAKESRFEYGGYLGSSLQAPDYRPSLRDSGSSMSSDHLKELVDAFKRMEESQKEMAEQQSKRIDRLRVVQVTSDVTKAQQKEQLQAQIGMLP